MDISIPIDMLDAECKVVAGVNSKVKNHKIDPGYEADQIVKHWYDSEDEGRIYDNLVTR